MTEKDEKEDYQIKEISENCWEISGLAPIDEVEENMGIKLPEEKTEDCETFSGYVCGLLGMVPEDGETLEVTDGRLSIEIRKVEEHRIVDMLVTLCPEKEPAAVK
jgi:hypothetical protein